MATCTAIKADNPRSRCQKPVTYSEHGHSLQGDYCDGHGEAVHRLRDKREAHTCKHCVTREEVRGRSNG